MGVRYNYASENYCVSSSTTNLFCLETRLTWLHQRKLLVFYSKTFSCNATTYEISGRDISSLRHARLYVAWPSGSDKSVSPTTTKIVRICNFIFDDFSRKYRKTQWCYLTSVHNDLSLDWIGRCPRNGACRLFSETGDACAVAFSAILNSSRYYICTLLAL